MSKKAKKKAKKEIIESAMQAVKAKVAAASNGEVKLKDGKDDEIYAMIASSAEAHGWSSMMLTDEPSETETATMSAKSTAGKEMLEDLSKCTGTLEELDNVIAYLDSDPWKPSSMMTADESKVVDQQEVVLGEELHSMQYVGIDTDSSRGASTLSRMTSSA